jgi:hypothetical protein
MRWSQPANSGFFQRFGGGPTGECTNHLVQANEAWPPLDRSVVVAGNVDAAEVSQPWSGVQCHSACDGIGQGLWEFDGKSLLRLWARSKKKLTADHYFHFF